jgi:hypothetical protein
MTGFGGRLFGFLTYGAQIRVLDDNFVPAYFDATYDRRRLERFAIYDGVDPETGDPVSVPGGVGWFGQLGFALLADAIVFDTAVSGSFNPEPGSYPELRSSFTVQEGIVPGFSGLSFQATYDKFDLRTWNDLVTAENALIGARINVRSGPVVISLVYDLAYDPFRAGDNKWTITSGLESTISF